MIKAVIFDLGGVIINMKPQLDKFIDIFHPKDSEEFWNELQIKAIPLCKGEITEEEYWKEVANSLDTNSDKIPDNLWTEDYKKLTSIDESVLGIAVKLKEKYKVALISNTIISHTEINRERIDYDIFDVATFSHDVKLTKENKEIFLITIKKLGVEAEECVFIDDTQKFVDTAKSLGMKGILFKNSEQLKEQLKSYTVEV